MILVQPGAVKRGAALRCEALGYGHAGRPVLEKFNLNLDAGDRLAVIGPSGCGKTTLLHLAAGLIRPDSGRVCVNDVALAGPRRESAIILQNLGLFPWLDARANVTLALPDGPRAVAAARADTLLGRLGLAGKERRWPHALSGGERQRVAIARALAAEPDLLLLDEAASALDALTREDFQELLLGLHAERGFTLLAVTHSIEEAVLLGRRLLVHGADGCWREVPNPVHSSTIGDSSDQSRPSAAELRRHPAFAATCSELRAALGRLPAESGASR